MTDHDNKQQGIPNIDELVIVTNGIPRQWQMEMDNDADGDDVGDGEKVVKEDIENDEKKEGVSHQ